MNNRQKIATFLLAATMTSGAMAKNIDIDGYGKKSITIEYADLNIADHVGAKVLYERIEQAASKICNVSNGIVPISVKRDERVCVNGTIEAAVERVNSEQVTQLHRS
jgi:UrcA family protein